MTTAPATKCLQCGGPLKGPLCEYCGTLAISGLNSNQEKEALELFHGVVAAKGKEEQINLLKHGFLPTDSGTLVDAGVRCVALICNDVGTQPEAAAARLKAIVLKLKMLPPDAETARAVAEFERQVKDFERRNLLLYVVFFGVVLLLLAGCCIGGGILIVGVSGILR